MKIIYPDKVTAITATEANAAYPASNLQDEHPNKVWRALTRDAKVTVQVGAGSNAVAVFATNATSVSMLVSESGRSIEWDADIEWDTDIEWYENTDVAPTYEVYDLLPTNEGAFWADYTTYTIPHQLELTFEAAVGDIVEAGVITAGTSNLFTDPKYGMQEGLLDYSVIKKLANDAFYVKDQDVVRTFACTLMLDRDTDFYVFMLDIAKALGANPFAIRVSTNKTNWEWVVYVRFNGLPRGTHDDIDNSGVAFNLLEVL